MSFAKLGSQHTVNTTVAGDQYRSAVTQLLNGDIVVAWTDANGAAINVRGQILNSDGVTRDGSEFMLNTTLSGDQFDVALTALGNGGFAAGWTSSADWPSDRTPPFPELLNDGGYQNHGVTQVFGSDGGKVGDEEVYFLDIFDYKFNEPYALGWEPDRYLQGSLALTANLASNSDDFDVLFTENVHIINGEIIGLPPVWVVLNTEAGENNLLKFSGSDWEILNNRAEDVTYAFKDYISPFLPTDPPNYPELDEFHDPRAITLADGTVITAYWREANSSNLGGVHVDISTEANTVRVGSSAGTGPNLAELTNGNIVVVWTDTINSSDGNEDIRGQIISADGTKIDGEFVVTNGSGSQWTPAVAALADGRFIVVWEDLAGDGDGSAIKGQVFTAAGDKSGEAFTVNTSTADDQKFPTVTALANGDAFVTWTDYDGATPDIYSQVIDPQSYVGDSSAETVYGGSFDDHLDGGDGADVLYGNGGDDVFENVARDDFDDDIFDGGAGTDTLDLDEYLVQFGPPVLIGANGTMTSVEVINLHGPTAGTGINSVELAIPLANSSSDETVTVNGALAQDYIYGDRINNADISLYLNGGGGDDYLYGGAGGDTLDGGDDEDTLEGNGGDDWLEGGDENDTLLGGAGIDYLVGGQGDDHMEGGSGGDTYFVDSAGDVVVETFDGLIGDFNFDYVSSTIDYYLGDYIERLGLDGSANIDGTGNSLDNFLFGNSGDNVLSGLGGIDDINGFEGADHLYGGSEGDELDGGADEDNLFGEEGDDTLIGGSEDDELDGGTGADNMAGGTGDDIYVVDNAGDVVTELNNQGTADLIMSSIGRVLQPNVENLILTGTANIYGTGNALDNMLTGNAGNNALTGLAGADHLYGFGGTDILWGAAGSDTMDGGAGRDTAVYTGSDAGVYVDLSINLYFGGHATGDTLTGIENLIGSSYDDVLVGYTGINVLTGGAGNDALFGVYDDDTLLGGKDNDTLTGGTGADVLNGGEGSDTASFLTAAAGLTVSLTTGTGTGDAQGDTFISIENLTGSGFTDTLVGGGNANVLDGGGGIDTLQGLLGDDTYVVDNVADFVLENANEGNDTVNASVNLVLSANVENLVLQGAADLQGYGNELVNALTGNAGINALNGEAGADTLTGDAGNDAFIFDAGEADGDAIADFAGNGVAAGDVLLFSGFGTAAGGATFTQIGATNQWQIHSGLDAHDEIITLLNSASVNAADFAFI